MGLRNQINEASAARAKTRRKLVTLPSGLVVEMRGMMAGDQLRLGMEQNERGAGRAMPLAIALCAFDPQSGEQVYNPNHGPDLLEIGALDPEVFDPLRDAALEVSGLTAPDSALRAAVETVRKEAEAEHHPEPVRAELGQAVALLDAALGGAEGNACSPPTKSGSSSSRESSGAVRQPSGAR